MKNSPLVSVIIPTYNRAPLLPRAIESVLAQTYENVEIIIVDDGSTDNTQTILKEYRDRIRCIRTGNMGTSHARNVGMRASVGQYIAFLDSDDSYYPYKLSLQVDWMERHPEIGMVSTEVSGVQDDGAILEYYLKQYHSTYKERGWGFEDIYPEREEVFVDGLGRSVACYSGDIFDFVLMGTLVMSNTILFRREALDVAGYQNENYRFAEDYEFVLRLCKHFRVGFIDVPTYHLYFHDGQISRFVTKKSVGGSKADLLKSEGMEVLLAAVVDSAYSDSRYYEKHKKEVDARMAELNAEIGYLRCKCGDYGKGRGFLRKSYEIRGKRLPLLRSCIVPFFPEKCKRLIRKMCGTFMSKIRFQS
jgi:glycosyltransferase involved in cell wall biosynthesis